MRQLNSFIIGKVRELNSSTKQWTTIVDRAQINVFMELVYPLIEVLDCKTQNIQFYSLQNLASTALDTSNGKFCIMVKVPNQNDKVIGIELHQVYVNGLKDSEQPQSSKILQDIVTKANNLVNDLKSPYKIKINSEISVKSADFSLNFDCQLAYYIQNQNRFGGYASVSLVDKDEARSKIVSQGQQGQFLVIDSEHSGLIVKKLINSNDIEFLSEEQQVNIAINEIIIGIRLDDKSQYFKFQQTLLSFLKQPLQQSMKIEDLDLIYQNQGQAAKRSEQLNESWVEDGPVVQRKTKTGEVMNRLAISCVDELIFLYAGQNINQIVLKDKSNNSFSGLVKISGTQSNLLTQTSKNLNEVIIFDPNVQKAIQEVQHRVKESKTVFTEFADFSSGNDSKQLLNTPLTSANGLVGISHNSIFLMDQRLKPNEQTVDESTLAKSKNYQHLLVTRSGHAIVACDNGDCSVFNKIGNRALNTFVGCGMPIEGFCVDQDEKFLLVTYKSFVVVYMLQSSEGQSVFQSKINLDKRIPPFYCRLNLQQQQNIKTQSFKPAFIVRNYIVAGCSSIAYAWNLQQVLSGKPTNAIKINAKGNVLAGGIMGEKSVVGMDSGFGYL